MKSQLFFEIPDDHEIRAKLVEAVPPDWSWLDGGLRASKTLLDLGQVEENTGFEVGRFHIIHPTIIGAYVGDGNGRREKPNLFAIMVEQKLPGFILFDEAGYDASISLDLTQRIAAGFLRKGYCGGLHFYKGCYDNNKYENAARCDMLFERWHGAPVFKEEAGEQPARVKLEWNGDYRGKEEDIASIAAVCRSLNLREYVPVSPAEAVV